LFFYKHFNRFFILFFTYFLILFIFLFLLFSFERERERRMVDDKQFFI